MNIRNKHLQVLIVLAILILFLSLFIDFAKSNNLQKKQLKPHPMVINFTAKWCSECQTMKKYVWAHWRIRR